MKVKDLIAELLSLCQFKKVEGFIFLREKETTIYLAEELSKGTIKRRKIELLPTKTGPYKSTMPLVLPFQSLQGLLDFDLSKIFE